MDDVREILYNTQFELNLYVTQSFKETRNTYKRYNYICKKAYELIGANSMKLNYKYDY